MSNATTAATTAIDIPNWSIRLRPEPDAAKRKALYPVPNDFLLEESFYMPITGNPGKVLATARLKGLTYRPNDLFMCTEAWLA